jgi:hypothetical protein
MSQLMDEEEGQPAMEDEDTDSPYFADDVLWFQDL